MFNRTHREKKFESQWIELFYDDVIDNNNQPLKYNVVHFKQDSVVVLVRKERELLLTENYRYPIEKVQLEFPAGSVEDGESPEEAAYREVLEETGIYTKCHESKYFFYPSNGIIDQKVHVVIANYVHGSINVQDEILNCYWIKTADLLKKVIDGSITDSPTIIALFYFILQNKECASEKLSREVRT